MDNDNNAENNDSGFQVCVQNANQPYQMSLGFHTRPEALTSKRAEIQCHGIAIFQTPYYKVESLDWGFHACVQV